MTSDGTSFTNFPENQLTTVHAFFLLVFLFISRSGKLIYNVNIKFLVCQIIGPKSVNAKGDFRRSSEQHAVGCV